MKMNVSQLSCETSHGVSQIQFDVGGHGYGNAKIRIIQRNVRQIYPMGEVSVTLFEAVDTKQISGTYSLSRSSTAPTFGIEIYSSPIEDLKELEKIMSDILSTFQFTP